LRVVNIIKTWLEKYSSDFDDLMRAGLKLFAENVLQAMKSEQILRILKQQQSGEASKQRKIVDYQFNTSAPQPEVPKNIFSRTLSFYDIGDLELARQLTIIEFDLFSVIKPRELLHQTWKSNDAETCSPNVIAMLNRFKEISTVWIPNMFRRCSDQLKRVKTAKRFLYIAQNLLKLNNFNTMMAILTGVKNVKNGEVWNLELSPKKKKEFKHLEILMIRTDLYQERLARQTPSIPYLEFHLKKIMAAESHIPSMIGKMVNFSKSKYIYELVSQIMHYQQTPYNLEPVVQIANLLSNFSENLEMI